MRLCRIVDALYAAVPFKGFRGWLIRIHVEKCASCQARLVGRPEALSLFVRPEEAAVPDRVWAKIAPCLESLRAEAAPSPRAAGAALWAWAAGAASLLVTAVVSFWLLGGVRSAPPGAGAGSPQAPVRFEMNYVKVGGAPARTFVYQPKDSDVIIVWAEHEL